MARAKTFPGFYEAIEKGDLSLVQKLLNDGADPNDDGYSDYTTPLSLAVQHNHDEIVALLIARGARATYSKSDWPPLFLARSETAVKLLLDHGAKIDHKDFWGRMPLSQMASWARPEVVKLLISRGADVNPPLAKPAKDPWSALPLVTAVDGNNAPVVEVLLANGAKLMSGIMARAKTPEIVELLLAHGAELGSDMLCYAKTPEMVIYLLGKGADPNVDILGESPLHGAAKRGDMRSVELLVQRGANVNAVTKGDRHEEYGGGQTPLHYAAKYHRTEAAKYLLDHGANAKAKSDAGLTALHKAAHPEGEPDPNMLVLLLKKGSDINLKDKEGYTPLSHAVRYGGCASSVRVLVAHGADADCEYHENNTALHWAATCGDTEMIEMLLKQGAKIKAQLDRRNKYGETPLHCAAARNHERAVELLLAHGASPGATDQYGRNPRERLSWLDSSDNSSLADTSAVRFLLEQAEKGVLPARQNRQPTSKRSPSSKGESPSKKPWWKFWQRGKLAEPDAAPEGGGTAFAAPSDKPRVGGEGRLRFDGLYHDGEHDYFRFYADGTVVTVCSTGTPEQVSRWLTKQHDGAIRGTYTLAGTVLTFTVTVRLGQIDYRGIVDGERLDIESHSQATQHRRRATYTFAPVAVTAG